MRSLFFALRPLSTDGDDAGVESKNEVSQAVDLSKH